MHLSDVGNYEPLINYIAEQVIWSLELSIKAAKGESIEETDDWEKGLKLLKNKFAAGTAEVTLIKSLKTLQILFSNSIIPIANAWEEKLKLVDPLFLSRSNFQNIGNKFLNNEGDLIQLLESIDVTKGNFERELNGDFKIKLSVNFKGLRNKDNGVSMNGGEILFELFKNAYEISFTNALKPLNKLYSEIVIQTEIDNIINSLGKWMIKNVEEALNN